jgi:ERCC4-type nuclease
MTQNITVVVDTREQIPWSFTRSSFVENVESRKLDTGDYSILGWEDRICIERKASTAEIANNVTQKRFFNELERMKDYEYKFLICEFPFTDVLDFPRNSGIPFSKHKYLKISSPYILKVMSQIQIKYGISVIYTANQQEAEILVDNLFRRIVERG